MAPFMCLLYYLRSAPGVISSIRKKVIQGDARLLQDGCRGLGRPGNRVIRLNNGIVRWQSTHIQTRTSKPRPRSHRVEENVRKNQVTVVKTSKGMFENTLELHPPPLQMGAVLHTAITQSQAQHTPHYQSLLELRDEAISEKLRKLLQAHSENSLTFNLDGPCSISHTYDSKFMLSDSAIENTSVSQDALRTENLIFSTSLPIQNHAQPLPSSYPGLAENEAVPSHKQDQPEPDKSAESIPKKGKIVKSPVKITKVVSTKKKKSSSVKLKKTDTSATMVEKATAKKAKDVAQLTHDQLLAGLIVEEENLTMPTPSYPAIVKENLKVVKKKVPTEKNQHLKEVMKKGRQVSFNQSLATYINVCMSLGMEDRATHTLLYYRQLVQQISRNSFSHIINTVQPYNHVLRGLAEKGNYSKMMELIQFLEKDKISANELTFACLLECLGRQEESPANTAQIHTWLNTMKQQDIDVESVLSKVDFVKDSLEFTLRALRRALPSYTPKNSRPPSDYTSSLIKKLNQTLHSSKVSSPAWGVLTQEQLAAWAEEQLEMEMKSEIVIKSIESLTESPGTQYYRELVKNYEQQWHSVLLETFNRSLGVHKKKFYSNQLDKKMTVYPYLVTLPPEEFVNIMLQEVQRLARGSLGHSLTKNMMYRRLGNLVFNRYLVCYKQQNKVVDKLRDIYANYLSWYLDNDRPEGVTYVPRVQWQELTWKSLGGTSMEHQPEEWPNPVLLSVGKFMYSLMLMKIMIWSPLHSQKHRYPAIYEVEMNKDYRVVDEIKVSPSLIELYQKAFLPTLNFETTKTPMVCPPVPWVSTRLGGYLLSETQIVRLPYNAHQQQKRMEECGVQQLYPTMDSLNQLSTIPWMINQPILDIIIQLFNSNGCEELDIPIPPSECPQPEKIHSDMSKAEVHHAMRQQLEYEQKKNEMHSLWCDALYKFSLAHHYRDRVFWFPHNMDFRGRVYPTPPHLNHLSSDSTRSILQFARGEKLGPNGLHWLKLHLINLTGLVKRMAIPARVSYCDDVMEDILDSADHPLDGRRWWTKSDEPWQTLAACKELVAALRSGDPEAYVSHLPIHQDGSCNGLQHYAALGRDEIGAKSVNLAPSAAPQDVYSDIAALVENERKSDARAGQDVAKVLKGHISRKLIKQTVMTTVYGVTRYGARLQIDKQLKVLDDFPQDQRWAASHYLVQKTFLCLEKMFTSTKEIQNWFTDCAKIISETRGQNLEYVTPLGLPVVQHYSNFKFKYVMDTASMFNLQASYTMDSYMKPNVLKQKNAFPPNFIHSLDSSHMMLTSLHCQQANITFVSVHDCFWTHACTVDVMNKICREQFVALHQEPILEDLSRFLERKFTLPQNEFDHDGSALDASRMKLISILRGVPAKGEFDIRNVLDSIYFFS